MDDRGRNGSWEVAAEKVIGEPLNEDLKLKGSLAQILHETFFSLNVGFAVTFAVLAFAYRGGAIRTSARYFLHPGAAFFLDHAAKINRLFHLDSGSEIGSEITACTSLLLIAVSVFLVLRLIARTAAIRAVSIPWADWRPLCFFRCFGYTFFRRRG